VARLPIYDGDRRFIDHDPTRSTVGAQFDEAYVALPFDQFAGIRRRFVALRAAQPPETPPAVGQEPISGG
jgi:hypothetical protein